MVWLSRLVKSADLLVISQLSPRYMCSTDLDVDGLLLLVGDLDFEGFVEFAPVVVDVEFGLAA